MSFRVDKLTQLLPSSFNRSYPHYRCYNGKVWNCIRGHFLLSAPFSWQPPNPPPSVWRFFTCHTLTQWMLWQQKSFILVIRFKKYNSHPEGMFLEHLFLLVYKQISVFQGLGLHCSIPQTTISFEWDIVDLHVKHSHIHEYYTLYNPSNAAVICSYAISYNYFPSN